MQSDTGFVQAGDGVRLFFQVAGHGSQVVIVPNGTYLIDEFSVLARDRMLVFVDPRNRGRSDSVAGGGILQDVEDLRTVAQQFSTSPVDLIGHSFAGLLTALYARNYPDGVRRVVLAGPLAANPDREFPSPLSNRDETFSRVMRELGALLPQRASFEPAAFCEKAWDVLRPLYVTNAADAPRITWGRCDLANERNGMRYFNEITLPSIRALALTAEGFRSVKTPVLVVHGAKDRSAPYGGGREWAAMLPDARLVTVAEGGHAPWIEAPDVVLPAIESFLSGTWPDSAEQMPRT